MRKIIFLHIGFPKTATTTLQKHIFPELVAVDYLGKFDNADTPSATLNTLIHRLIFEEPKEECLKKEFTAFFQSFSADRLLISEESFLSNSLRTSLQLGQPVIINTEKMAEKIRSAIDSELFDVRILLTVRRQDEMVTSLYAQSYVHYYSRFSETNTFKKFVKFFTDNSAMHPYAAALNYWNLVSVYRREFGLDNVKVFIFEELKHSPDTFYRKLFSVLGEKSDVGLRKNIIENIRASKSDYKLTKKETVFDRLAYVKRKYLPRVRFFTPKLIQDALRLITLSKNSEVSKSIRMDDAERAMLLNNYRQANYDLSESLDLNLGKYGYYD